MAIRGRALRALPADASLIPSVVAALRGTGPGVLPLPVDAPDSAVAALLAAARLERPLEREDIALVVPTSGSTGAPKLALLSAAAIEASARATLDRLGGPGRWVLALPLTHVAGLQVVVRSVLSGEEPEPIDLSGGFTPEAFVAATRRVAGGRAYTALVPTQLHRLVQARVDLSAYAAILLGGAAADPALLRDAAALGGRVVTTYGMTETCGGCVYDGTPLKGVQLAVGEDGRVRLGGPVLAAGYRMRPDLTAESFVDGWFVTSDLGELGSDGRLRILGRADDVIVTGGEKVAAGQVEATLRSLPGVSDAVVVGLPNPEWGQVVAALVECAPHHGSASASKSPSVGSAGELADALRDAVRERLGPVAAPRRLVVVPALPRTSLGKPDRAAARRLLEASQGD